MTATLTATRPEQEEITEVKSIGVSGTREGMSDEQAHAFFNALIEEIRLMPPGEGEVHHGACEGTDAFTHFHMQFQQVMTHVHPPTDKKFSAFDHLMRHNRRVDHEAKPYPARNQDIVDASQKLIAAPRYPEKDERSRRSGTWQAVRMAAKAGKPVTIVDYEDGKVHPYGD